LLSPESAERARREEQRLIAEDDARIERLEQQASPLAGRSGAEEPEEEDEDEFVESGAFDGESSCL
jgi:LPS O-antigen subunit length determinant protein (WzzB/FepE family)